MRVRLRVRDFLYLAAGAMGALLLVAIWSLIGPLPGEVGVQVIREANLSYGFVEGTLPEAYWIPGPRPSPGIAARPPSDSGALVACTLPLNAELLPVRDEQTGTTRLVRPGGGDERRLAMAVLTRRAVLWSEPRWRLAEQRAGQTCPEGRVLVLPSLLARFGAEAHS